MADVSACREGRTLTIDLPATPRNEALTCFARDPHAAERFNAAHHRAELTDEDATLFAGAVRLLKVSEKGFTLEIRDGGAGWARRAALRMLGELGIDFTGSLDPVAICRSWTDDTPVKFFPIRRDEYPQRNAGEDLLPAERIFSPDDYHPFLHIATLVERIFTEAGYTLRSRFLRTELFRSLYMSGAYASRDTTAADKRMGFRARRTADATATADALGCVHADPAALAAHSVGNIVDTATPGAVDADGEPIPDLCNNGGCFSASGGRIRFTPPAETGAGFEYYLKFTTAHRILNRTRLLGFDRIYLGPGAEVVFRLANRYEDCRATIRPGFAYRVVVFEHAAGAQYRLSYTRDGIRDTHWTDFAARTAEVVTPVSGMVADPVLRILRGGAWTEYAGDWALYEGHVGETGETTVELRVRTPSRMFSPGSPARFDTIRFSGAEPGMRLSLHKDCSLRPLFLAAPGYGSRMTFADVTRFRIRQSTLLEALAHLFNLRFYTDEELREAIIEPADDFFCGSETDWTAKTDFSQPVELEDLVTDVPERRVWGYLAGDGAVKRFEADAAGSFGEWAFEIDCHAAKEETKELRSPLFSPTLSSKGHYLSAPSARMLQVGDRDAAETDGDGLTPRIVRYAGMHPLPPGERWGYPWDEASYPLAAFHFEGDDAMSPFTLCFEDRDWAQGLHRFYDRQLAQEAERQRITFSLRIAPHEFAALLAPGTADADIRSVFRLDTGRGVVRATLQRIAAYDPKAASVRCTFIRLPED